MTQFTILSGGKFPQLMLSVPKDAIFINAAYHRVATVELGKHIDNDYQAEIYESIPYGDFKANPAYYVDAVGAIINKSLAFEHVYIVTKSYYKGLGYEALLQICDFLVNYSVNAILFDSIVLPSFISDITYATADTFDKSEKELRIEYIKETFVNLRDFVTINMDSIQFFGTSPFQKRPLNYNRLLAGSFCYLCTIHGESNENSIYIDTCDPSKIKMTSINFIHHVNMIKKQIAISGVIKNEFNCILVLTTNKQTQMPNNIESDSALRMNSVNSCLSLKSLTFSDWKSTINAFQGTIDGVPNYTTSKSLKGVGSHPLRVRRRFQ